MFTILDIIKCPRSITPSKYFYIIEVGRAGVLHVTRNSPYFITGKLTLRAKKGGEYPYGLLKMIDYVFGPDNNTIEVCSGNLTSKDAKFRVDKRPETKPDLIDDAQYLSKLTKKEELPKKLFTRWRCDPPYNEHTANNMYKTSCPDTTKLLSAGSKVVVTGSLMFLLLGNVNKQHCPSNVKRVGWIPISMMPNNEVRALHIYIKEK